MNELRPIPLLILVTSALFGAYLVYPSFRETLSAQNIDPNFVLGFIAVITILVSMWQNSKDRRLTYNMTLLTSLRDNGLAIISKLVAIRTKSEILLNTMKSVEKSIENKVFFIDGNNTASKEDIDDGFQLITAYADTYFQEECEGWNDMLAKLSEMGTDNMNILKNYEANWNLIKDGVVFSNPTLDDLANLLTKNQRLKDEIEDITANMRNRIVTKINGSSSQIKEKL